MSGQLVCPPKGRIAPPRRLAVLEKPCAGELELLLVGMDALVPVAVGFAGESLGAGVTDEGFFAGVGAEVGFEVVISCECLEADFALESAGGCGSVCGGFFGFFWRGGGEG